MDTALAATTAAAIEYSRECCQAHTPQGCPMCAAGGHDDSPERIYSAAVRCADARLPETDVAAGA